MSNYPNSQQSGQSPWWQREKKDKLPDRIKQIQRVNDPTTYADEVLSASKILLVMLLSFSGILGGMSYFKNFSLSMPLEVAIFLALTLTVVIEWGKNKASTWAVRIPFFQGWSSIWSTPSNTFIFGGLALVAIATFFMSVYNSTKGGEQLALMLSHEKNHVEFKPNTQDIDAQVSQLQHGVSNAPMTKWKGKMYYQDAKAVRAANKSIESLQRQREDLVKMQRADYERNLSIQASQSNFASKLVLASGGWIELLQVLIILLRVACEKKLDDRAVSPTLAFKGVQSEPAERKIGFNVSSDGNVRKADGDSVVINQPPVSVPQTPQSVPQINASVFLSPEEALRWFESELKKEPSNFTNKHANENTVAERINLKLLRAQRYLTATPDNTIPNEAADRFERYLTEQLFPVLEERQYQPNYQILSLLQSKKEGR